MGNFSLWIFLTLSYRVDLWAYLYAHNSKYAHIYDEFGVVKIMFEVVLSQFCVYELTDMVSCVGNFFGRNMHENKQRKQYGDLRQKEARIKLKKCFKGIHIFSLCRAKGSKISMQVLVFRQNASRLRVMLI